MTESVELGEFSEQDFGGAEDCTDRLTIYSFAKSGRTWMRWMIADALSSHYNLGVEVDFDSVYELVPSDSTDTIDGEPPYIFDGKAPKVAMSHAEYADRGHGNAPKVLLVRDPRDVLVSHYMHNTRQEHKYEGEMSDYLRSARGVGRMMLFLSSWAPHIEPDEIITYEAMRADTPSALKRTADILHLPFTDTEIGAAVAAGEFGRMQASEAKKGIIGQYYDANDTNTFRVRRGVVGGYVDYMSPSEYLEYVHEQIVQSDSATQKLIAITGYSAPHPAA